jgi:hypothetical protein
VLQFGLRSEVLGTSRFGLAGSAGHTRVQLPTLAPRPRHRSSLTPTRLLARSVLPRIQSMQALQACALPITSALPGRNAAPRRLVPTCVLSRAATAYQVERDVCHVDGDGAKSKSHLVQVYQLCLRRSRRARSLGVARPVQYSSARWRSRACVGREPAKSSTTRGKDSCRSLSGIQASFIADSFAA